MSNKRNPDIQRNSSGFAQRADRGIEAAQIVGFALVLALATLAGRIMSVW